MRHNKNRELQDTIGKVSFPIQHPTTCIRSELKSTKTTRIRLEDTTKVRTAILDQLGLDWGPKEHQDRGSRQNKTPNAGLQACDFWSSRLANLEVNTQLNLKGSQATPWSHWQGTGQHIYSRDSSLEVSIGHSGREFWSYFSLSFINW